jgi:hypothetical protein
VVSDPDGTTLRARKDSYAGSCVDCGTPTSGWEGRREDPRCLLCASRKCAEERRIWTRGAVILAIQEWAHEHGEHPAMPDWNPWYARHEINDEARAARAEENIAAGRHPWPVSVIRAFGTWNAAIRAAGFEPRPPHGGGGNGARHRSVRARAAA